MKLSLKYLNQRLPRLSLPKTTGARLGMAALALSLALVSVPTPRPAYAAGGTVVAWGRSLGPIPAGLNDAIAIAAGGDHSLALKSDGTVVAWGGNFSGQSNAPAGLSGVTAIAAGGDHSLALKSDGTVVAWGQSYAGLLNVPAGLGGVTAIAAGSDHSIALKSDGTVVAWGLNQYAQRNVPAGLSGVIAIAAGHDQSLALKSDGTVVAWGCGFPQTNYGQCTVPTGLGSVMAVDAGHGYSLALKGDGTVAAWGDNRLGQTNVPAGLSGVIAIAAGADHSLALKSDGTVVAWGWSGDGQGQTFVPHGLSGVTAIAAGYGHNLAIKPTPVGDPTPPVITPYLLGTPGNNGWFRSDVRVAWTVSDAESPITEQIACGYFTIEHDFVGFEWTCSATSGGGTSSQTVSVKLDKTAPTVSSSAAPAPNVNGWNNSDVTVTFSGVDATSGIAGCSAAATLSADGAGQSTLGTCTDNAGNTASATVSTINIDKTKPVITGSRTPAANANGWNNTDVTVSFTCTDSVSGVDKNSVTGATLTSEGANQALTNTGACADRAGNSADPATVSGINIDKTAPDTTITANPPANGTADATFAFTGSDALAGVVSFECSLDGAAFAACTSPANYTGLSNGSHTFGVRALDATGNADPSPASYAWNVNVQTDAAPPTASPTQSPAASVAGWNNSDVTVAWNWSDSGTGIDAANCTTSSTSSGEGLLQLSATCRDVAGNTGNAVYTVKVDKTAPTLNPVVNPNPVLLNATATANSGSADALSGLASQSCGALDTNTVGSKSIACTATDNAGNTANANASYTVIYAWSGFFQPVDNLPVFNQVKAGSAIPVKFSLGGNQGLSILATGSPASQQIACDGGAPVADIEQTVNVGNSSLSYDPTSNQYQYTWKTEKGWSNTCRQLIVTLIDGTHHLANFKFK